MRHKLLFNCRINISLILARFVGEAIIEGGGILKMVMLITLTMGFMLVIEWGVNLVKRKEKSFRASCYSYGDRLLICAICPNDAGFYNRSEPYRLISKDDPASTLGEVLLEVLDASNRLVPIKSSEERKESSERFLQVAEITSERKLQQTSLCCSVSCKNGKLCFKPEHNGGTSGDNKGFSGLPDDQSLFLSRKDSPEEIGKTLMDTLERCTSVYDNPNTESGRSRD
jgi:hypothetical protein